MNPAPLHSPTLAETAHALRHAGTAPGLAMKRQANRLVAALVAVAMLFASALPSHADKRGDDLAKALAAMLVLGLVVNAIDNSHSRPKPKPQPVRHPRVPVRCAIEMDSDHYGRVSLYPERCLRAEGFNHRLPDCGRWVRIYGQPDWVYSGQCLREAGFRVDR